MHNKCPICSSSKIIKNGFGNDIQTYQCKNCKKKFSSRRREKRVLKQHLWNDYVFHKQTIRELSYTYKHDRETIKHFLDSYNIPNKIHNPRKTYLLADALYFGKRTNFSSWCAVVFRDSHDHENLWWKFSDHESTSIYLKGKQDLEFLGYDLQSVTADGLGCIRTGFSGIPYQMCLAHMERLIIRGTTRNPKTIAGEVLLLLAKELHNTDKLTLQRRLAEYFRRYSSFLSERTIHPDDSWSWTHENLRQASISFRKLFPYLFTYEKDSKISKTTNSLEGYFSHVRDLMRAHRGASKGKQQKILSSIFLASTTAPPEKRKQKKA